MNRFTAQAFFCVVLYPTKSTGSEMTPTLSHTVFSMLGMNEYIIGVPELHPDLDEAQQVIFFYTIQPNTPTK